MELIFGWLIGFGLWFIVRVLIMGVYTVDQSERAVKTVFGRAERIDRRTTLDDPISSFLGSVASHPTLKESAAADVLCRRNSASLMSYHVYRNGSVILLAAAALTPPANFPY